MIKNFQLLIHQVLDRVELNEKTFRDCTEERRIMKKLSLKKRIRQIKLLNKNLRKMNLRKTKRVKDEKKAAERERALPRNR